MLLRALALAAVVGAFMAAVGAFGSSAAAPMVRYGYWVGIMLVGAVGSWALARAIGEERFKRRPLAMSAVMIAASTPPMVLVVWASTTTVYHLPMTWRTLGWFVLPVLLVATAMTALSYLIHRAPGRTHAAPAGAAAPRFLDRLPPRLRGAEIHAVQAEDHYLRLHTSRGSDLILMRLSDAIGELEGIEGARTHRSWWVARDAILDVARSDGRAMLTLKGGVEAPVSRTYARSLRQARWW